MSECIAVSAIVCAHSSDRIALLQASLRSLQAQSMPPGEIIAVIDHNDSLRATIASQFAGIIVLANTGHRGLSDARNTGIAKATGEVVAFLDDDAQADPEWLARLCRHYADHHVMAVGGRIVPVWPGARPAWFPPEFDWVVGCSYRGQPTALAQVRNLIGCNMSFRRAIFARTGGFSAGLGREGDDAAGCEETELCIRARKAFPRSVILYDPDAAVSHILAEGRTTRAYFRTRCRAEGRSKAAVVASAGTQTGLSSERAYVTRTLPVGVLRGLADLVMRFDVSGFGRAWTILAGLAQVSGSYLMARGRRADSPPAEAAFLPIRIMDVELSKPAPMVGATDSRTGTPFGGVFALVRDHGHAVDIVEFPLYGEDVAPDSAGALFAADIRPVPAIPNGPLHSYPFARVVIATRDRPDALARCLDSLLVQDYADYEVVVVDNAPSSTATRDMVAQLYATSGRISYLLESRPGLGHAHNCGIAGLAAPIVAFTDDDVIIDPQWLRAIATNFATDPLVGCVTGLILPAELDTRAQYWTERHGGFGKGFVRRRFDLKENRPHDILFPYAAGTFGSGANMAFSREALNRIAGFDAALGAGTLAKGGDDLAAFSAVVKAGFRLVYEPGAIVWHHHRRGEEGMRNQAYGYGVGLGAYLTKVVVDDPPAILHFARALPSAAVHLLSPASGKNSRLPADYPRSLRWRERLGMLAGIPAYFRSRASLRRYRKASPPAPSVGPSQILGNQQ